MKPGRATLRRALTELDLRKADRLRTISGILGATIDGEKRVTVNGRPGFVYVRLRDNLSEIIAAYNGVVALVYDLPVLVARDENDMTRYRVIGRDIGRYQSWGLTNYVAPHANQHQFGDNTNGGGDIVWVYGRQMMPLMGQPSGSAGSGDIFINPYPYWYMNKWHFSGNTGTASLLTHKPTGTYARMVLVLLDLPTGNYQLVDGVANMPSTVTGTAEVMPYVPNIPTGAYVPITAVRLLSGTSKVVWENLYDVRNWFSENGTGTAGGGAGAGGHIIKDEGVPLTQRAGLNFTGPFVWAQDDAGNNETDIIISGTYKNPQRILFAGADGYPDEDQRLNWDYSGERLLVGWDSLPTSFLQTAKGWIISKTTQVGMGLLGFGSPGYGYITAVGSRGTFASPLPLLANDLILRVNAAGRSTGTWSNVRGRVEIKAQEDWGEAAMGTYLDILLTASGTTTTQIVLTLSERGDLHISGTAHVRGFDMPPGAFDNKLLRTNAAGVAYWGAPVVFSPGAPADLYAGMIWVDTT